VIGTAFPEAKREVTGLASLLESLLCALDNGRSVGGQVITVADVGGHGGNRRRPPRRHARARARSSSRNALASLWGVTRMSECASAGIGA